MYIIDKDVPIPQRNKPYETNKKTNHSKRGVKKYPFHEMERHDSFFIETEPNDHNRTMVNVLNSSRNYAKRCETIKKFITRKVDGGVRCWRLL
jgi:hypothetical protein